MPLKLRWKSAVLVRPRLPVRLRPGALDLTRMAVATRVVFVGRVGFESSPQVVAGPRMGMVLSAQVMGTIGSTR